MRYNFDEVPNRRNTCSEKWDGLRETFGTDDVLPMWVADMDFKSPHEVVEALVERSRHGIFGYPLRSESYYEAIIEWVRVRHGWEIKREWIVDVPSVMPGLAAALLAFTSRGNSVVLQPPVYPPFFEVTESLDRRVIHNLLKFDGSWHMDLEGLKGLLSSAKAFLLCSPHNPVGRVWSEEELSALSSMCAKAGVPVLSDEIHCDFVYRGYKHIPIASINHEAAMNTVTFMSASKTFNIAGFKNAYAIVPNPAMREKLSKVLQGLHFGSGDLFGILGLEIAYRHGRNWLDELLLYLEENRDLAVSALRATGVGVVSPQGTYLLWLDFRKLGMSQEELMKFLINRAKLGLNDGLAFGPNGAGFARMNIGCPRRTLEEGLHRLTKALS
ncbi:bifunctional PLP-dependent enzyme with beta-cystathionase and maltose regulon repressor activities [Acetomicrobium mobile DSM 13181]|uniref:cysteine-S-conjugate beta-lyase n=1 Tax=Acetomicrobium mobile (strain ATCC BAA-54 / DSM 13181 / JCM 12221 / NGA) TaxID=891968 RepID=I4BV92_ACEMN|nr:MalY/PatB family protein [Acetomicrobium mobile]AFM21199.1 bifunctional PLP-dependent enzyme with beta-cystathionase and maltose regulon repressor activities [Acetomicrobium mobile DSM 13181]